MKISAIARAGGHVALVRHGATAGGAGDPPGFRLDDCTTQRNFTEKGRAEARRLGEQFRSQDVTVGKLMSSQWCRCQETADTLVVVTHGANVLPLTGVMLEEGGMVIVKSDPPPNCERSGTSRRCH